MNEKLKEKLTLTTIGFGFLGLNLYANSTGKELWGLGFGIVAFIFFIKSLRIK